MKTENQKQPKGVWDERQKKFILPSGTVKQGRRPMFKPHSKTKLADLQRAADESVRKINSTGKPILDTLISASESFAEQKPEPIDYLRNLVANVSDFLDDYEAYVNSDDYDLPDDYSVRRSLGEISKSGLME